MLAPRRNRMIFVKRHKMFPDVASTFRPSCNFPLWYLAPQKNRLLENSATAFLEILCYLKFWYVFLVVYGNECQMRRKFTNRKLFFFAMAREQGQHAIRPQGCSYETFQIVSFAGSSFLLTKLTLLINRTARTLSNSAANICPALVHVFFLCWKCSRKRWIQL